VSLIDEALKKQREEAGSKRPGSTGAQLAPPPLPSTPQSAAEAPAEPPRRRSSVLVAVGVGVLILVLLAGTAWLIYAAIGMWQTRAKSMTGMLVQAISTSAPPHAPASTARAPIRVVAVSPDSSSAVTQTVSVPPPLAATNGQAALRSTNAAVVSAPLMPSSPVPPAVAANVSTGGAPPLAVTNDLVKPPIVWPRVTVTGLMGESDGTRGAVILNGQMLSVGESIEGVRVTAVTKRGVQLSFGGEIRKLKVGESTE
jgi:hypothetical protein